MSNEKLPACILVVLVEIDASAEAAWNEWYDNVHLPEALACPGVLSGRRYRSASEVSLTDHGVKEKQANVSYVTLYALSSEDAVSTPEFIRMAGWYDFTGKIKARTQVFHSL